MTVEIPGKIKGKARARVMKGYSFTPQGTVDYENWIKLCWQQAYKESFKDKQIAMAITAYYSIPKSYTKKVKEQCRTNEIRPAKKPDSDNIAKIVADSLNKLAYDDDKQIVELKVDKWYTTEEEKLVIEIWEV
jgi:Holliday junction resolvase RusA-like endonuclease